MKTDLPFDRSRGGYTDIQIFKALLLGLMILLFHSALCECSSEVLCASVLVKCFVQVFWRSALCKCSSEVLCASVVAKCFVRVF
jgi:hypothetical protein